MLIQHLFSKLWTLVMNNLFIHIISKKQRKMQKRRKYVKLSISRLSKETTRVSTFSIAYSVCTETRSTSSTIPDVMKILCQPACFYFHLKLHRGSISIPHVSFCYFSFELHICAHRCIYIFSFLWASQQHRRQPINRHSPVSAQINFPVITSRYPLPLFSSADL